MDFVALLSLMGHDNLLGWLGMGDGKEIFWSKLKIFLHLFDLFPIFHVYIYYIYVYIYFLYK